jgi:hypothetical protein
MRTPPRGDRRSRLIAVTLVAVTRAMLVERDRTYGLDRPLVGRGRDDPA